MKIKRIRAMIEKDILIQAQNGDEEAIEEIIKQHEKIIYINSRTFFERWRI
ncbi:helix-turn-helix domain-containing protein (plasmid) [Cetobacterium somerae]|uniref:helix-turn-helix domain-containing protein n=1 Tax=Cetobacterium somerae TaxID=188913 RepID=UPI0038915A42